MLIFLIFWSTIPDQCPAWIWGRFHVKKHFIGKTRSIIGWNMCDFGHWRVNIRNISMVTHADCFYILKHNTGSVSRMNLRTIPCQKNVYRQMKVFFIIFFTYFCMVFDSFMTFLLNNLWFTSHIFFAEMLCHQCKLKSEWKRHKWCDQ